MTDLTRRSLLGLIGVGLAAPAIIRTPGLLMPVRCPLIRVTVMTFKRHGCGLSPQRALALRSPVRNAWGELYQTEYVAVGDGPLPGSLFPLFDNLGTWKVISDRFVYMRTLPKVWTHQPQESQPQQRLA